MHKLYAKKHQQKEMHMLHTYKGNLPSEISTKRNAHVTFDQTIQKKFRSCEKSSKKHAIDTRNSRKYYRDVQVVCRVKIDEKTCTSYVQP